MLDLLTGLQGLVPRAYAFLLLQSNDLLSKGVGGSHDLKPDLQAYGGFTGMFAQVFLIAITMIGGAVHNYGLAIIFTCLLVRIMLLPLTRQQINGMKLMQALQPVQKEIQRFYPNKQDQNAKLMELYQTYKINPLASCLPMLIQLPILFGVYRALYDPSFAGKSFLGIQLLFPVELTLPRSYGIGPDLPDIIDVTVAQLNLYSQIWHIPANIPLLGGHFVYWPALGLVVLYVISSLWMQRTMKKVNQPDPDFEREFKDEMKSSGPVADDPNDMAKQMQRQMGFMNIMILVFAFFFSAGALIYFIVQNAAMSLEYTLLSKGINSHFNAKEMKAFIRRPPPPIGGPGGPVPPPAPAGKPKGDGPKPLPPSSNGKPLEVDEPGIEVSDTELLGDKRPQKKRRKR
ncbi:membrane protein insertase YidC [bacterium]|nr:membrane protein insertase YidC [bacterium]